MPDLSLDSLQPQPLSENYYAECNRVFRAATNQPGRMLEAVWKACSHQLEFAMLSVGSGTGLFEMPMLEGMRQRQMNLTRFEAVDISQHACEVLRTSLLRTFNREFDWTVEHTSFEHYDGQHQFDFLLFNHVFEYFDRPFFPWIQKALNLLSPGGAILLFSPQRGGINAVYEQTYRKLQGEPPLFAGDLEEALNNHQTRFAGESIQAECDISALARPAEDPEKLQLLSFLTQIDARHLHQQEIRALTDFFQSLAPHSSTAIPHPTTLFTIHSLR